MSFVAIDTFCNKIEIKSLISIFPCSQRFWCAPLSIIRRKLVTSLFFPGEGEAPQKQGRIPGSLRTSFPILYRIKGLWE